ncbi:hydrophobic surface binding protein A [Leptodontidium sp. MPI-SDFR-AT-0119]|nr:hydrophobic surface binding protein A [Leptodontidium sp. MPI-SDFR-AT-0119]
MQLISAILPLLLSSTLSLASPVTKTKRAVSTVLSDIATISSDVATLTSDAGSYTGGLFQSLALAITVDNLESAIKTATSDTTSSATFSSTDSDSILSAVTTLTPKIITLLSDLDGIASTIASAGYTSTVESALKTLTTDTDALFVALEAKVDSADAADLAQLQAEIDAAFATAVATF